MSNPPTPQYGPPPPDAPRSQPPQTQHPQPQYPQPPYGAPAQPQPYQQPYQQPYGAPGYVPQARPGPGEPFDGAYSPDDLGRPLYGANLGQAFTRFFRNYANFKGRASRSEYWWMAFAYFIFFIGLLLLSGIFSSTFAARAYSSSSPADLISGLLAVVLLIVLFGSLIPSLALTWRRLHDANLAGPLYFLVFVPYAGGITVFIFTLLSPKPQGRRFDTPR